MGDTTLWFSDNFEKVYTIEVNEEFQKKAKEKCKNKSNIEFLLGDSVEIFPSLLKQINERVLFYLDAHGYGRYCPTPKEMCFIAGMVKESIYPFINPIILIHDFKNPNHLNYTFPDFEYNWDLVKPFIRNIYNDKFDRYFNEEAEGAKVGLLYVEPLI